MPHLRPRLAVQLFQALLAAAALALLVACQAPAALTAPAPVQAQALDPVSSPDWARDMGRFAAEDAATPPPREPVVFTGSSSVRFWTTLADDFPGVPVMNRGFGGSQVRDSVHYADEVALRYRPRQVLIYAGDNDIDAGRSPQQVLADFQAFVARLRGELPAVRIGYLAIKPSPLRIDQLPRQQHANGLVRDWAATQPGVDFIDVATPLLDAAGQPREDLFVADRLHLNAEAYALWRAIVAPYLRQ